MTNIGTETAVQDFFPFWRHICAVSSLSIFTKIVRFGYRNIFFFFFYVFGDHLGLYFRYDIEYNTLGVMTMEMEMEQGDQRGGLISLNLWQCLRFPHSPVFSRIRRFVLLLYSLDRTLQCMRCGGRPARFSTVQESHRSA